MKDLHVYLLLLLLLTGVMSVMDHYGWAYPNDPPVKGAL
jgi:hypothetical protein